MKAAGLASLACYVLLACGDDAAPARVDAGEGPSRPRPGFVPRGDNQMPSGDPLPDCDRFDPLSCGAGQECRVVIRRIAGAMDFEILDACVEGVQARALGDPCDPWGGGLVPYKAPGLETEVYVDPCEEGLFCGPDPDVRNSSSCQTACARDFGVGCASPTQYCLRGGMTSFEDVCRESDGCDPSDPTACGAGAGCYVRLNDRADGVLSVCLPVAVELAADGEPCEFLNSCEPGSWCFPSARVAVTEWVDSDWVCHRACQAEADPGTDAGDEDAGLAPATGCASGRECVDLQGAGFDTSQVGFPVAQCE